MLNPKDQNTNTIFRCQLFCVAIMILFSHFIDALFPLSWKAMVISLLLRYLLALPQICWPNRIVKGSMQMLNNKIEGRGDFCSPLPEMPFMETISWKHQQERPHTFTQHLPGIRHFARSFLPEPRATLQIGHGSPWQRKGPWVSESLKTETCHTPKPCFFHDIMGPPFRCRCH